MKKGIRRVEFFPREWGLERCFSAAADAGFEGMELIFRADTGKVDSSIRSSTEGLPPGYHPWQSLAASVTFDTDEKKCSQIRGSAEASGVRISSLATGYSLLGAPDTPEFEKTKHSLEGAVIRTKWLGGAHVLISFEKTPPDTPDETARQWAVELLRRVVPTAEKESITLAYELVWPAIYSSPEEIAWIIERVDSENLGCYFDPANIIENFASSIGTANDSEGSGGKTAGYSGAQNLPEAARPDVWLSRLGQYAASVHIKDYSVEYGPVEVSRGDVPWQDFFGELEKTGYDGWLVAELEVEPADHLKAIHDASRFIDRLIDLRIS